MAWRRRLQLRFYTRNNCPLCVDAEHLLRYLQKRYRLDVDRVDLESPDTSDEDVSTYLLRIPVVTTTDGDVIGEGNIDPRELLANLRRARKAL